MFYTPSLSQFGAAVFLVFSSRLCPVAPMLGCTNLGKTMGKIYYLCEPLHPHPHFWLELWQYRARSHLRLPCPVKHGTQSRCTGKWLVFVSGSNSPVPESPLWRSWQELLLHQPFPAGRRLQHSHFDTQAALPHFASLELPLSKGPGYTSPCNTFQPSTNSNHTLLTSAIFPGKLFWAFLQCHFPLEECSIYI